MLSPAPVRDTRYPDPALDAADPMDLLRRYHRTGDRHLREAIVERHAGLVRRLARRFDHRGEDSDDLVQVAYLGLLKAIDRFDPDRGLPFASFAVPTIIGELKRHFRDHRWQVQVPRSTQENFLRVRDTTDVLVQELKRPPTVDDIAQATGLSTADVEQALLAANSFRALSLDYEADGADPALEWLLGQPSRGLQSVENRQQLSALLNRLPEGERNVIRLRFAENLSQREIAERIGLSQMGVSRLLNRTLGTLRAAAV
ncbi:MAG TPA: SigB/SigF/SigG family RNA polymerase sigma factor [Acidimicrobiia bacterium]|nr:SigB/SigF/SigG family RNA polymerase sigma factor [Acidimicrobiia bacterium]